MTVVAAMTGWVAVTEIEWLTECVAIGRVSVFNGNDQLLGSRAAGYIPTGKYRDYAI